MSETNKSQQPTGFRPRLSFFHPNAKGTGCAIQLELHPAHDRTDGSIWLSAANQMTVGDRRAAVPTFPRFDWENKIVVKLDFFDLSRLLQVFRGECETLEDGKGLYHATAGHTTRIVMRHLVDANPGYSLELYRTFRESSAETAAHIVLNDYEAHGLAETIAGAMIYVSFGIPMVVPRENSSDTDREGGRA